MSTTIVSRTATLSLAIAMLLTMVCCFITLEIMHMGGEITVLRAQAASRADVTMALRDYRDMNVKAGSLEFRVDGLAQSVKLLQARKDEVTTADMIEFSSNVAEALGDVDDRLKPLEEDHAKKHGLY